MQQPFFSNLLSQLNDAQAHLSALQVQHKQFLEVISKKEALSLRAEIQKRLIRPKTNNAYVRQQNFPTEIFKLNFSSLKSKFQNLETEISKKDSHWEIKMIVAPHMLSGFFGDDGWFQEKFSYHNPAQCSFGAFCVHHESGSVAGWVTVRFLIDELDAPVGILCLGFEIKYQTAVVIEK